MVSMKHTDTLSTRTRKDGTEVDLLGNPIDGPVRINPLRLGRKAKPTKKHRPAIWENMLGTVYACNAEGESRYFDYDWDAAMRFAGVDLDDDLRTYRKTERVAYVRKGDEPRHNQFCLWVTK